MLSKENIQIYHTGLTGHLILRGLHLLLPCLSESVAANIAHSLSMMGRTYEEHPLWITWVPIFSSLISLCQDGNSFTGPQISWLKESE